MAKTKNNKRAYTKPFLSHEDQLKKLKNDGMKFKDEAKALYALRNIGYYRLSGYWFTYQIKNSDGKKLSTFKENTYFEDIIKIYRFDEKLRHIILAGIAEFEISLRAHWAYYFAEKYGSTAYCDPLLYKRSIDESLETLNIIADSFRKSKEKSIIHYKNEYSEPILPPTWIIAGILSFGTIINLLNNLRERNLLQIIADKGYALENEDGLSPIEFSAILKHMNDIRNICAHCNRLWNRNDFPARIPLLKNNSALKLSLEDKRGKAPDYYKGNTYNTVCLLNYFLRKSDTYTEWKQEVKQLISAHSSYAPRMGFPDDWQSRAFWQ